MTERPSVKRRLPAEWEPQSGIMLTWPHAYSDWQPILARVEPVFVSLCAHTSQREKVLIVARDKNHQQHILQRLTTAETEVDIGNIVFGIAQSNDSWARDHGAITVIENDRPVLLDFQFNAWGGKYDFQWDNQINTALRQQKLFAVPLQTISLILEGGSIESDGVYTLLTNQCLLTRTRNPGLDKTQIESALSTYLGITRFHWLSQGKLAGDDTDAHIDTLARFVSKKQIAYVACNTETDEHFQPLQLMERELSALRTADNQPYDLIPLPLPDAIYNDAGQRLPATYANFLIINDAVLLPVYGQENDEQALDTLQKCFPTRDIIAINCLPLIHQFGSLHCVTMQFPKGVLA
ncbi:MAG TPA: agmatine deiminase family protein [Gammaproteobacteria bacterium]